MQLRWFKTEFFKWTRNRAHTNLIPDLVAEVWLEHEWVAVKNSRLFETNPTAGSGSSRTDWGCVTGKTTKIKLKGNYKQDLGYYLYRRLKWDGPAPSHCSAPLLQPLELVNSFRENRIFEEGLHCWARGEEHVLAEPMPVLEGESEEGSGSQQL